MDIFKSNRFWNKNEIQKLFVLYLFLQLFTFFAETTKFNKGAGWDGPRYLTISKYGLENLKRREESWHIIQSYVPVIFYNIGVKTLGMPKHSSAVVKTFKAYTLLLNIFIFILLYRLVRQFTNKTKTQLLVMILYLFNYSSLKWSNYDPVGREATTIFLFLLGFNLFIREYKLLFTLTLLLLFFNHCVMAFFLLVMVFTIPLKNNNNKIHLKELFFAFYIDKYLRILSKYNLIILGCIFALLGFGLIYFRNQLYLVTTNNLLYGIKPIFNSSFYMIFTYLSNAVYPIILIYVFNSLAIRYSKNAFVIKNFTPLVVLIFLFIMHSLGNWFYHGKVIGITSLSNFCSLFGIKPFESYFSHFYYWGFIFLFILFNLKNFLSSSMEINFLYGLLILFVLMIFALSPETRAIHGLIFVFVPVFIRVLDNSYLHELNIFILLVFSVLVSRFYINLNDNSLMYFSTPGYFNSNAGYLIKVISSTLLIFVFILFNKRKIKFKTKSID